MIDVIIKIIKQTHKLQNFWIKWFSVGDEGLTRAINDTTKNPKNVPMCLTPGIPFLLSKGKGTKDPKIYHPITCLPIIHKILMAVMTNRIYNHLLRYNNLPEEQKVTECLGDVQTSCW